MLWYAASFYVQNLMPQWAKSYALLCCVMICYADLFYEQNIKLSMSKSLWSVMLPLLRDCYWSICEQNLMHRYEFIFLPICWNFCFLNQALGLRKSFLNKTTYVLKNSVVPIIFIKSRFFLKSGFLKSRFHCTVKRAESSWYEC